MQKGNIVSFNLLYSELDTFIALVVSLLLETIGFFCLYGKLSQAKKHLPHFFIYLVNKYMRQVFFFNE